MFDNTFLLQAGNKATLVASADLLAGTYQNLNRPGEAPDAPVNIAASETVHIGPFNTERYYGLNWNAGSVAVTQEFGGFPDFSEEPPADVFGGTPVGTGVTKEETVAVFKRTVLSLVDTPLNLTDDPGVIQFGGVEIFDFPQGNLIILSAKVKGNFTSLTGTMIPNFTGSVGLGTTTAIAGATLATTQSDILPSTAITTAVAKVAAVDAAPTPVIPNSGARWLDGRVTAKKAFLNFKVTDDATHTSGTAKFTGEVEIIWTVSAISV
jgi:hypothetical protein